MSSGDVRRVSPEEIQLVQNLIERCLQLYMNQQEVVETLLDQAKIEPDFTELVWQKLEEENQEFFKAYHLRLMLKQQITVFNKLLEQQADLMRQMVGTGVASNSGSNGSDIPQYARRIDAPPNMFHAQSSDIGIVKGMNGGMIKLEPGYAVNIPLKFGVDGNALETRQVIGDGFFYGVEANSQSLHEPQPLMNADTSAYGFLKQIPRNPNLSDFTADFCRSSDILESYSRSRFLTTDTGTFLDYRERGENQGDNKRLSTISEYENLGSG